MDLRQFLHKDVVIKDIDGTVWHGHAVLFDLADDNDNKEDSITIRTQQKKKVLIEFAESEIQSIELA